MSASPAALQAIRVWTWIQLQINESKNLKGVMGGAAVGPTFTGNAGPGSKGERISAEAYDELVTISKDKYINIHNSSYGFAVLKPVKKDGDRGYQFNIQLQFRTKAGLFIAANYHFQMDPSEATSRM